LPFDEFPMLLGLPIVWWLAAFTVVIGGVATLYEWLKGQWSWRHGSRPCARIDFVHVGDGADNRRQAVKQWGRVGVARAMP